MERLTTLRSLRADVDRLEQALDELQVQMREAALRKELDQLQAELRAELREFATNICEERHEPEPEPQPEPQKLPQPPA